MGNLTPRSQSRGSLILMLAHYFLQSHPCCGKGVLHPYSLPHDGIFVTPQELYFKWSKLGSDFHGLWAVTRLAWWTILRELLYKTELCNHTVQFRLEGPTDQISTLSLRRKEEEKSCPPQWFWISMLSRLLCLPPLPSPNIFQSVAHFLRKPALGIFVRHKNTDICKVYTG